MKKHGALVRPFIEVLGVLGSISKDRHWAKSQVQSANILEESFGLFRCSVTIEKANHTFHCGHKCLFFQYPQNRVQMGEWK